MVKLPKGSIITTETVCDKCKNTFGRGTNMYIDKVQDDKTVTYLCTKCYCTMLIRKSNRR